MHWMIFALLQLTISDTELSTALNEWRINEFYLWQQERGNLFTCPACPKGGHAVHLDGNQKLYRYAAAGRQVIINCLTIVWFYTVQEVFLTCLKHNESTAGVLIL